MGTTLVQLQTGRLDFQYVLFMEGWDTIYTDGSTSAALTAHAGYNLVSCKGGLTVTGKTTQKLNPWVPFTNGGDVTFCIQEALGDDALGTAVARSDAGAETLQTATIKPGDVTVPVLITANFPGAPEFICIGTETIKYQGKTATTFTSCIRGYYAPFGTKADIYFGHTHRIAGVGNGPQLKPVVSEQHRSWIGRWVGLWAHRQLGAVLDTRAQAQLVFAGKVVDVQEDSNGRVIIKCQHLLDVIQDMSLVRDQFSGQVQEGAFLWAGMQFNAQDWNGASAKNANALICVSSGAAGANQFNEGYYTLTEFTNILNNWLAAEKIATRLNGTYQFSSPMQTDQGFKTMLKWRVDGATNATPCNWKIKSTWMQAWWFFGFFPTTGHSDFSIESHGTRYCDTDYDEFSDDAPFTTLVCQGWLLDPSDNSFTVNFDSTAGTFISQTAYLPQEASDYAQSTNAAGEWGLFQIDNIIAIGMKVDSDTLTHVHGIQSLNGVAQPWGQYGQFNYGRRAGDNSPLVFKQIFVLESSFARLMFSLFISTGQTDYNDDGNGYDVLGYGLGLAIPYELLGDEFLTSLQGLEQSDAPMRVFLDKPTKFKDLVEVDLLLRMAYLVWKNGKLTLTTWQSPATSIAVHTLDETNKARPSDDESGEEPPIPQLTGEFARNIVKVISNRSFLTGTYADTVNIEDTIAVDDAGGDGKVITLPARNMTSETAALLLPSFVAGMRMFTRPLRLMHRSIGVPHFEGVAPGDIATVTDDIARDPTTGARGVNGRPALIVEHEADWGGWVAGTETVIPPVGRVALLFAETNRVVAWHDSARVDDTVSGGGFVNGYDNANRKLRCKPHQYNVPTAADDATKFVAGDVIEIYELDPKVAGTYLSWVRTVQSQTGDDIVLTVALSAPAWDGAKKYGIRATTYTSTQATQKSRGFQADDADARVQDTRSPFEWGQNFPQGVGALLTHADLPEKYSTNLYGDGVAFDVATEHGLAKLLNNLIEHGTTLNSPQLSSVVRGSSSGTTTDYDLISCRRLYLGRNHRLSGGIHRLLEVDVWARSKNPLTTVSTRVTLTRYPPTETSGQPAHRNVTFDNPKVQHVYTHNSTTYGALGMVTLDTRVADSVSGLVYLCLEMTKDGETRLFNRCRLPERT